jgi:hypothetical protein
MSGEDDAGDEGRSDRLRRRRSQRPSASAEEPSGDGESDATSTDRGEAADPSATSEPSKSSELSERTASAGVKSEQVGTYMYLPEGQKKELERLYNVLKAEYEYEYDTDFEKNRHFYPLVVQYGLERLDGLDASELRERLDYL